MLIIRENKLIAAILGGLVAVIALVLIFSGGSDSPTVPLSDIPDRASTAAATTPGTEVDPFPGPDIEQLECGPLLTFDDIDPVLDSTRWLTLSRGESCTHQLLDDASTFVRIHPGHPTDLIDGGILEGVPGQPVPGVGDAAAWFAEASTLSVAAEGRFGVLVFRITVSNAELNEPARLEAATNLALAALPRFPGIEVEPPTPPDPVVITIEHEPVDRSNQGFVENLLAREADGDWTRGEGLVATLRFFTNEVEAGEVLRHPELLDDSGTGVVHMARAYLETDRDSEDAAEIERLLDLLLVNDPRGATATEGDSTTGLRRTTAAYRASQEEEEEEDCFAPYPDYGDPCFLSAPVSFPQFGEKYILWFPDLEEGEEWEGWVKGDSTIQNAMIASATKLESMSGGMPDVAVWLSPFSGGSTVVLDAGLCAIQLNKGAQALGAQNPAFLQQAIASALARCYIVWNFGLSGGAVLAWWEPGVEWYLSDVIYPNASMELVVLKVPQTLAGEELGSALTDRSLTTMTFFEYLDAALGLEGTMAAVQTIAESGPDDVSGIDDLLHEYNQALTDGVIVDQGGAHAYGPPADSHSLAEGVTISEKPQPYGLKRIRVSVASGQYACLEYPDAGNPDITASWREGPPGESGSWTTELPESVQGQGVFLLTTTEPGGQFTIKVTDIDDDDPNCEDEEEAVAPPPTGACEFCDPTDYWRVWENWRHMVIGS